MTKNTPTPSLPPWQKNAAAIITAIVFMIGGFMTFENHIDEKIRGAYDERIQEIRTAQRELRDEQMKITLSVRQLENDIRWLVRDLKSQPLKNSE